MSIVVRHWAAWISSSALSNWFQSQAWVVPTSQSLHILGVSVVFGCALMINLRLLGVSASGRSVSQLVGTLVPWMYRGLGLLLLTGMVQTIAEPLRQFVTPAFWWKQCMVVCVVGLTVLLARSVRRDAARWDAAARRPAGTRLFALLSLGLWVGIIFCGRFIGYTWLYHV